MCIIHLENLLLLSILYEACCDFYPVSLSFFSHTSEEIRGEILFVLYKFSALQFTEQDVDGAEVLSSLCPRLLCLSLEALAKTQRDDVRLNCVGTNELLPTCFILMG